MIFIKKIWLNMALINQNGINLNDVKTASIEQGG